MPTRTHPSFKRTVAFLIILLLQGSFGGISRTSDAQGLSTAEKEQGKTSAIAVCPPFHLRDEQGEIIDPIGGVNATTPYSPKQTCGAQGCHDYAKITEGFHFQAGRGEPVTEELAQRYDWVTTPGYYGGRW